MGQFIEGVDRQQAMLLPECLDDYVGNDSAVRTIDAFVDMLDLAELGFCSALCQFGLSWILPVQRMVGSTGRTAASDAPSGGRLWVDQCRTFHIIIRTKISLSNVNYCFCGDKQLLRKICVI